MPIFEVTSPDGRVIEVTAPEGATEEQAIQYAQSNWEELSAPKEKPAERSLTESALRSAALTGKAAYKGLTAIPALAGEALALPWNVAARGANYFGANLPESHPSRALSGIGEKLYPISPETTGERLSEDVISAVGSGAGMLKAGQALSGLQGTAGRIGTSLASQPALQLAGAGTSGLASGVTREAGGGQVAQILAGLGGGFAPAAGLKAYDLTRMVASPAYKSIAVLSPQGKKVEADDILRKLAENEPQQIQSALAQRRTYVQGQKPTTSESISQYKQATGETIGSGLVKLQETLKRLPETSSKLQTIDTKRLAAHGNIIGKIAGSEAKMNALLKARTAATAKLYETADNVLTPVDDKIRTLIARVPSDAMAEAKKIAQLDGVTISSIDESGIASNATAINGKSMIYMLKGLKEVAYNPNTPPGVSKSAKGAIDEFTSVLEKTNPAWKIANKRYADFSKPINRMEIGRILADKLQNASLANTPGQFLKSADEAAKTIKTATGISRLKSFEEIMSNKEINAIKAVSKDIERMLEAGRIANKSTLPGAGALGETAQINVPSLLSRPVAFSKWALSLIGKDVSPEINKILADTLADPQKLAIVLKNTPKDKIPELMRYADQFRSGAISGTAPIMQQEQQQ
ncbi:MAG: hypothetical protein WC716_16875 [Chitinophagaceae bacterium]|jgi:hypothetical protein